MAPIQSGSAGWATVVLGCEATVWRTGRGAGALAVLFMLAAETEAAGDPVVKMCGWGLTVDPAP